MHVEQVMFRAVYQLDVEVRPTSIAIPAGHLLVPIVPDR
jgi:hypothetical protein